MNKKLLYHRAHLINSLNKNNFSVIIEFGIIPQELSYFINILSALIENSNENYLMVNYDLNDKNMFELSIKISKEYILDVKWYRNSLYGITNLFLHPLKNLRWSFIVSYDYESIFWNFDNQSYRVFLKALDDNQELKKYICNNRIEDHFEYLGNLGIKDDELFDLIKKKVKLIG